jgi:hypothetical protein
MLERVGEREEKMEGSCSTGQSPHRAVVPVEEEEEEEEEEEKLNTACALVVSCLKIYVKDFCLYSRSTSRYIYVYLDSGYRGFCFCGRPHCSLLAYCTARFGRSKFGHQMPPRLPTRSAL